jgi:hypothetical protein
VCKRAPFEPVRAASHGQIIFPYRAGSLEIVRRIAVFFLSVGNRCVIFKLVTKNQNRGVIVETTARGEKVLMQPGEKFTVTAEKTFTALWEKE